MKNQAKFPTVVNSPRGAQPGPQSHLYGASPNTEFKAKSKFSHVKYGSQLDEDSMVSGIKHSLPGNSLVAATSIDDGYGGAASKRPAMEKPNVFASPRAKRVTANANSVKTTTSKKGSEIDSLYASLRALAQPSAPMTNRNGPFHMNLMDSINRSALDDEKNDGEVEGFDGPALDHEKSLILATGNIRHDDRVLLYTIREFLGTCFSITLNVPVTGQNWVVFVSSSESLTELMRVWKLRPLKDHKTMLTSWLLSCITIEFEDLLITKAGFDRDEFHKKYMRELMSAVRAAAITIQRVFRGHLARNRVAALLMKMFKLQESRELAQERAKRHKAVLHAKKVERSLQNPIARSISPPHHKPSGNQNSPPKKNASVHDKVMEAYLPGQRKKQKEVDNLPTMLKGNVELLKEELGGAISSFQKELEDIREQIALAKMMKRNISVEDASNLSPENSSYHAPPGYLYRETMGSMASPGPSVLLENNSVAINQLEGEARLQALTEQFASKIQDMNDVNQLKTELSRVVMKVGNLEELLDIQKKAFEKVEGKAKLEIAKARLAAELAAERAAERVRAEAIAEMQIKMKENEDRLRAEEEINKKLLYEQLYSDARKKEHEKIAAQLQQSNKQPPSMESQYIKPAQQMPHAGRKSIFPGWAGGGGSNKSAVPMAMSRPPPGPGVHQAGYPSSTAKPGYNPAMSQTDSISSSKKQPVAASLPAAGATEGGESLTFMEQMRRKQQQQQLPPQMQSAVVSQQPTNQRAPFATSTGPSGPSGVPASSGASVGSYGGAGGAISVGGGSLASARTKEIPKPAPIAPEFKMPPVDKKLNIAIPIGDPMAANNDVKKVPVQNSLLLNAMVQLMGNNAKNMGFQVEEVEEPKAAMTIEEATVIRRRVLTKYASRYHFNKGRHPGGARLTLLLRIVDHISNIRIIQVGVALSVHAFNDELARRSMARIYKLLEGVRSADRMPPLDYENITSLLNCFASNLEVLAPSLDLLNLAIKVLGSNEESNERIDVISETGICDVLMRIIGEHPSESNMVFKITKCLSRLTVKHESNKLLVGRMDNALTIKGLIEQHMKMPNILENLMKVIVNCVIDCPLNQDTVGESGLVDAVMIIFEEYIKIDRILGVACRCIINIAAHNHEKNQSRFLIFNRPLLLKNAIAMHKKKPKLLEQLIWSVLGLISNHKMNKKLLQKVGMLSVLVKLLDLNENPPGVVVCAVWATSNLASVNNKKMENVNLLILEALKVLEKQMDYPDINRHAKMALNRVFGSSTGRNSPVTPGTPATGGMPGDVGVFGGGVGGGGGRGRRGQIAEGTEDDE